jgi:TetR/AcrR family transcriptional regulator
MAKALTLQALRADAARFARPSTCKEEAILRAATAIFGEKGYEGARTADIAAAAGVTERTLFRYFSSKDVLYRRVMFPAILASAVPRVLTDAGKLFASESGSFREWHRQVLRQRLDAAKRAIPQFRLLVAGLMSDEALRDKIVVIWKAQVLVPLTSTLRRLQAKGEVRTDVSPERLARMIISVNLGFIFARALIAPDAAWDDEAEIDATVDGLLRGVGVAVSGK